MVEYIVEKKIDCMSKLVVDKKHKKIDASKIGKPLKRITSGLLGTVLGLSMYSGVVPKVSANEIQNDKSIVSVDELDIPGVSIRSYGDTSISIRLMDGVDSKDLQKLKNLHGVETIFIDNSFNSDEKNVEYMKCLPESTKEIMLSDLFITNEIANVLNNMPNLEVVNFNFHEDFNAEKNAIELMNNIKKMSFNIYDTYNCDIDFKKLTFLNELALSAGKYTLPIWFNMDEYNTLVSNGVKIDIESDFYENSLDDYLKISKKLDEIVSSLGVTKENSDKEKLDAILIYVLENLEYDPEIRELIYNGVDHEELSSSLYIGGPLYAIFNRDTAVCGNYSALFEALADRLFDEPMDSYVLRSEDHAWNLVNIDGELYYVDSTWLDDQQIYFEGSRGYESYSAIEAFKEGKIDLFDWYMQDNFNYDLKQHNAINSPYYVDDYIKNKKLENDRENYENWKEISAQISERRAINNPEQSAEKVKLENNSNKKVNIKINGKTIATTLGAIVGCMAAMGLAYSVKERDRRRRLERRRRQNDAIRNSYNSIPDSPKYGSYSSNYGRYSSHDTYSSGYGSYSSNYGSSYSSNDNVSSNHRKL